MRKAILDLVDLCRYAAQHPRLVQGGGGNCSVKFANTMAIKASGFFLEDVSEKTGYAFLDLKTGRPTGDSKLKVSLETPLHQLLNTYVIHTHPVVVAALVCAKQGKQIFRELFPDSVHQWIEYASPGQNLFETVEAHLAKTPALAGKDQVLFLQNHGLFTASSAKERCRNLHDEILKTLESFFGEPSPGPLPDLPKNFYFTPDHVVYSHLDGKNLSGHGAIAAAEIDIFARQVYGLILKKNWDPQWLPEHEIRFLLNMDEEKYRQNLWKQAG